MIDFDTSLVVRIAVGDNPEQRAAALALVDEHRVLIPKSVVLETEWVLRARYGLRPAEIIEFLAFLLGSEGVVMEVPTEDTTGQNSMRFKAGAASPRFIS